MTLKNLLRQRYSGTFFDSRLLRAVGPVIDTLDRAAQSRKNIPPSPALPPFSLRRHYLAEIRTLLKDDGAALFSCFIYDQRESIRAANPHAYGGGFVANLDRPMKQISFPLEEFVSAIEDAGLELLEEPILRAESHEEMWPSGRGLGQDVILVRPAR